MSLEQTRKQVRVKVQSTVLRLEKTLRFTEALELNAAVAQEAYELTEKAYWTRAEFICQVMRENT